MDFSTLAVAVTNAVETLLFPEDAFETSRSLTSVSRRAVQGQMEYKKRSRSESSKSDENKESKSDEDKSSSSA